MGSPIRAMKRAFWRWAPDSLYIAAVNAKWAAKRRSCRMQAAERGAYRVVDGDDVAISLSQRARHIRYKHGVLARVAALAGQYRLGELPVEAGGVMIDCGANVGEIGLWARGRGLDYHAFEPEEAEATCCDLNNYGGERRTNRLGLWNETGELKLYSKAGTADSSLIPIEDYDSVFTVPTTTLDDYVRDHGIERIEVLKVEAEGAEPEVLHGAERSLDRTRYVAVDCGRERGVEKQDTVRDVCNLLFPRGFRMIDSDLERLTFLFEKTAARSAEAA